MTHFLPPVKLSNGVKMPMVGLGTYRMTGYNNVYSSLKWALENGYRLIDTAAVYRNESDIATALEKLLPSMKLTRKDIFITSKLAPKDHGKEKAGAAIKQSLANLKTDYLDLYLIHWPGVQGINPQDKQNRQLRQESWSALEDAYRSDQLRAIGVSNYEVCHLEDFFKEAQANKVVVPPHVNQIEVHPHFQQEEVVRYCRQRDIHVTAYSSLGRTVEVSPLLNDPTVKKLAEKTGRSAAQVLLRWAVQKGYSVLPKSTKEQHIRENIQLDFELGKEDMDELDATGDKKDGKKYAWNPNVVA